MIFPNESDIIDTQIYNVQLAVCSCKEHIFVKNIFVRICYSIIIRSIELSITYGYADFASFVGKLCAVIAFSVTIEPATLVTEGDRLTPESCGEVAEAMVYEQLISIGICIFIILKFMLLVKRACA